MADKKDTHGEEPSGKKEKFLNLMKNKIEKDESDEDASMEPNLTEFDDEDREFAEKFVDKLKKG